MALSIGVHVGSQIRVGPEVLTVEEIGDSQHVSVQYGGKRFLITDAQRTKVADEVFVSCGSKGQKRAERYTRLAFEAPRDVRILRV